LVQLLKAQGDWFRLGSDGASTGKSITASNPLAVDTNDATGAVKNAKFFVKVIHRMVHRP
jgi:hypothetical protein